jgi:hypothetical protein
MSLRTESLNSDCLLTTPPNTSYLILLNSEKSIMALEIQVLAWLGVDKYCGGIKPVKGIQAVRFDFFLY